MSILSSPTITEPIYECAASLYISGYVAGANVAVFAEPPGGGAAVVIGGGVSNSGSGQIFGVNQANMVAGARITAVQSYSAATSPPSAAIMVQSSLSVDAPVLHGPLYECARCVSVDGLLPGVNLEIRDGGTKIGQGSVPGPSVQLGVGSGLVALDTITARQVYCGTPGPDSAGVTVTPVDPKLQLPTPEIENPIFACQPGCVVRYCAPGCQVELFANGLLKQVACASGTTAELRVPGGLVQGFLMSARLTRCSGTIVGPFSAGVFVQPTAQLPRPAIWPPLYEGDTSVLVGMTIDGETVTITAGGSQIGMGGAGGGDALLNIDLPLITGQMVVATVELCSVKKESLPVFVQPRPPVIPAPLLAQPLYACSLLVNVAECLPGAEVRVFAELNGTSVLLGLKKSLGDSVVVNTTPVLHFGWAIYATQTAGGVTSPPSDPVFVEATGAIPAPTIRQPVFECSRCVEIENLIVGAFIDVYQNNVWFGSAEAWTTSVSVPVTPLTSGATISVTQSVCGKASHAAHTIAGSFQHKMHAPQLLPAAANQTYVDATGLVPGAIVQIEEISVYHQVIGEACATVYADRIRLNLSLFTGAVLRARQRLCQSSPYSPTIEVPPPPEWPLGPGPYQAGFRLVSDIPVSESIYSTDRACGDTTYDFITPETNSAIIFYPATSEGENQPVASGGTFPVIVFGHALRLPSICYTWEACNGAPTETVQDYRQLSGILSHLARWGFVCMSPDLSWAAGHLELDPWLVVLRDAANYMITENSNTGSPFLGRLETAEISMMGHSTGGYAVIKLGVDVQLSVGALGLLAPAGGAGVIASFSPRPIIVFHGTNDTSEHGDYGATANVYAGAGPKKHMITIPGGNHFGFTDSLCILGEPAATISQADQQTIAKAYLTAFFRRYVQGVLEVQDYLSGRPVEGLEAFGIIVNSLL